MKYAERNNELKEKFLNYCKAEGLGKRRIEKYEQHLRRLSEILQKPFDKATKEDIEKLVRTILEVDYSEWTKHDYKTSIKRFYKWLRIVEIEMIKDAKSQAKHPNYYLLRDPKTYPYEVAWIKTTVRNGNHKLPEELLNEEEIKKLIKNAFTTRDKAFIITLYESGCRIGEMLSLKIKNIEFVDNGTRLIVHGKTGDRRVLIITSTPYIRDWLNQHPDSSNPNAPLWITYKSKKLIGDRYIAIMIKRVAEKAGIKKRVNPHSFRHARASFLANYMTESQLKQYFGWTQGSDMAQIYVHLSGRDTDNALLKMYGMKTEEEQKKESVLKSKKCFRCGTINKTTNKFCSNCAAALDAKTAVEVEKIYQPEKEAKKMRKFFNQIENIPEVQKIAKEIFKK